MDGQSTGLQSRLPGVLVRSRSCGKDANKKIGTKMPVTRRYPAHRSAFYIKIILPK